MIALGRMVSGLALWAAAFVVLYSLHGLGCALGWAQVEMFGITRAKAILLGSWIVLIAAQLVLLVWLLRRRETQLDRIGIAIGWIGLAATIVTGVPILAISSCV
ncbi:MAG: hypothetical protein K5799_10955 [Erythrobacter sp.]|nr:hypothetical protein [Erythrobacter sp.]